MESAALTVLADCPKQPTNLHILTEYKILLFLFILIMNNTFFITFIPDNACLVTKRTFCIRYL